MSYKLPVSVLVVIHTADLEVLLLERARRPGYNPAIHRSPTTSRTPC